MFEHVHESWKALVAAVPGPAVLVGYAVGAMQALAPILQLLILVLTVVSLIYSIGVSRKKSRLLDLQQAAGRKVPEDFDA